MKILLIKGDEVVTAYNHSDRGTVLPIIASLLLESRLDRTYVAGKNLYPVLARINIQMENVPGWRMRISSATRRHAIPLRNGTIAYRGTFFVDYFSIDSKYNGRRLPRRRIDVINLERFIRNPPADAEQQLEMAIALLKLADSRKLRMRNSNGALGSAILKTMPSWEKNRHAAPRFINKFGRSYLPGNYYGISERVSGKIPFGYYLDQTGSHHSVAQTTPVPHPHYLRARGYHKDSMKGEIELWKHWTKKGEPIFNEIMEGRHIGLLLARMQIGHIGRYERHLYPPWAQKRGERYIWIWTPELRFALQDQRIQLDSFMAGFTSTIRDSAIAEYGMWSLDYLKGNLRTKAYTKPALLAAYGMLAFNSESHPIIRRYWGGQVRGNPAVLPEAGAVSERKFTLDERYQHAVSNVIARGVIEAETRTRSLEYAKELHMDGYHVAQIYSDGILVADTQLPFIREGWRIESEHTNIRIPRPNAFISDQVTKLPGIPKSEEDNIWMDLREKSRKPLTATARV